MFAPVPSGTPHGSRGELRPRATGDAPGDDRVPARHRACSLRRGGGLVDTPGRWLVGAKGNSPLLKCLSAREQRRREASALGVARHGARRRCRWRSARSRRSARRRTARAGSPSARHTAGDTHDLEYYAEERPGADPERVPSLRQRRWRCLPELRHRARLAGDAGDAGVGLLFPASIRLQRGALLPELRRGARRAVVAARAHHPAGGRGAAPVGRLPGLGGLRSRRRVCRRRRGVVGPAAPRG